MSLATLLDIERQWRQVNSGWLYAPDHECNPNKCEIEQGRRCDSEYVDEVEKFAYSSMTLSDLIHLRKIQKNQCN